VLNEIFVLPPIEDRGQKRFGPIGLHQGLAFQRDVIDDFDNVALCDVAGLCFPDPGKYIPVEF
jgi:hypothetical protein